MTQKTEPKKTPWQLIAILVVTVVPLVGAYVVYYTGIGMPDDAVNEGELITQAPNFETLLAHAAGEVPTFNNNRKWRLLVPVPNDCTEQCLQNLYVTRQVHIRLGEKGERVERYAVNVAGEDGSKFLESIRSDHPRLKTFDVPREHWNGWLAGTNVPDDPVAQHYYLLVDQLGFAMMFYTADHEGNQLLKDIKRILRYSPEE